MYLFITIYQGFIHENIFKFKAKNFPRPGDWIFIEGESHFKEERFEANLKELEHAITSTENFYKHAGSIEMADALNIHSKTPEEYFSGLFNKISYHFVNQHSFANFKNYPKDDRIVYIGGMHVEENENYLSMEDNKYVIIC
ncbi:unnamed protein product [Meloidogyne enterolobii]|uniref:Uncharacterized protein n=1 Tax=Meloidogyne enterolobii TaxID=390850 RepID=A0ACB0Z0L1_MELEN